MFASSARHPFREDGLLNKPESRCQIFGYTRGEREGGLFGGNDDFEWF